jgi:RimJ/RimL family protein N-acetyltransferase
VTPIDWRHTRTDRLWLDVATLEDCDDLRAIHSDPRSWTHFPEGLHTDRSRTPEMVAMSAGGFDRDGLGYWCVRDAADGPVIGWGGCGRKARWWNLAFRLSQDVLGRGYATEMATRALVAAQTVAPEVPVIAYLLEHNVASRRTTEKLGLTLAWRGPDRPNRNPNAIRLVYVDRKSAEELVRAIEQDALGF